MKKVGETKSNLFSLTYEELDGLLCLGSSVATMDEIPDYKIMSHVPGEVAEKIKQFYQAKSVIVHKLSFYKVDSIPDRFCMEVTFSVIGDF